jgi:ubiquinone/menaquinone biosynthesis C-methylase UbiE
MSQLKDTDYLLTDQYRRADNLTAHIQCHERFSTNPYGWFQRFFDQFDLPSAANLLVVRCGTGLLCLENLSHIPPNWRVALSDFSSRMVSRCKQLINPDRFRFLTFEAGTIFFSDGVFDLGVANHMLYHIRDRQQAMAEIARVLKPTGCLYASTHGQNLLQKLDRLIEKTHCSLSNGLLSSKRFRSFCLENGTGQLSPWFTQVEMHHYEDSLQVTAVEPLLAYIYSVIPVTENQPDASKDSERSATIRSLIRYHGCIHIQKSSGIFLAKN